MFITLRLKATGLLDKRFGTSADYFTKTQHCICQKYICQWKNDNIFGEVFITYVVSAYPESVNTFTLSTLAEQKIVFVCLLIIL